MTPMGSRRSLTRRSPYPPVRWGGWAGRAAHLLADALQRPRDAHHLLVRELLRQRVGDPVDGLRRLPGDQADLAPVEVAAVRAAAHAHLVGRVVEDRRGLPGRSLDAVVLADL